MESVEVAPTTADGEGKNKESIVDKFKDRVVASLCRETLKLSNSKSDKAILKEAVKIISSLAIGQFEEPNKVYNFAII